MEPGTTTFTDVMLSFMATVNGSTVNAIALVSDPTLVALRSAGEGRCGFTLAPPPLPPVADGSSERPASTGGRGVLGGNYGACPDELPEELVAARRGRPTGSGVRRRSVLEDNSLRNDPLPSAQPCSTAL